MILSNFLKLNIDNIFPFNHRYHHSFTVITFTSTKKYFKTQKLEKNNNNLHKLKHFQSVYL